MRTHMSGARLSSGDPENSGATRMSGLRIAAWAAAVIVLLAPLVAMQFTDSVDWSPSDFVFAGVLLFGSLGVYELVVRKSGSAAYRTGAGLAIVAAFLLIWINGAVGITDSDADGLYLVVAAIGIVGALVARFRPAGMAIAMVATAVCVALVGVIALIAGIVPDYNSVFEILGLTGFFVVLFAGSALLFREAARGGSERSDIKAQ